jgi:hypothetical protein
MNPSRSLFLVVALLAVACSTTETTIIRTPATVPSTYTDAESDPVAARPSSTLRVAELIAFESFDPLIARTSADFRKIQLVYEGLVRLDATGTPVPALASSVEVAPDSMSVTFRLRETAFFHNDPAFSNGIGRKVNAADVIAAFERMTHRDVPETAAELFAPHILGFDLRNRENRDLFVPSLRQTTDITGIQRIDSRTVRFLLNAPDKWFLHRLASPLAVIYPAEAVPFLNQRPVGSGPYRYQASAGDSLFTFVLNSAHPDTAQFRIRRVDVRVESSETKAYRAFVVRDVDVIAETGPLITEGVPDLNVSLARSHRFATNDQVSIALNIDNQDALGLAQGIGWFQSVWSDSLTRDLSDSGYERTFLANGGIRHTVTRTSFKLTPHIHEDQISRRMVVHLRRHAQIDLLQGYVASREVTFYTSTVPRVIPGQVITSPSDLVRFDIRGFRLSHPAVLGFDAAPHSWWFDLRGVTLTR